MGILKKANENKESIIYTILTIVFLECVRIEYNKIQSSGEKNNLNGDEIYGKQKYLTIKASLIYSLIFLLPLSKYVSNSIQQLFSNVDLQIFKTLFFPIAVIIFSEIFLAVVIFNLLGLYIKKMNTALNFFKTIRRSIVDGSKIVADGVRKPMESGMAIGKRFSGKTKQTVSTIAKSFGSFISVALKKTKSGTIIIGKNFGNLAKKSIGLTQNGFKKTSNLIKKVNPRKKTLQDENNNTK